MKEVATFTCQASAMQDNLNEIAKHARDLKTAAGSNTIAIDDFIMAMLLKSLPLSYNAIRTVIETNTGINMEKAFELILSEEQNVLESHETKRGFAGVAVVTKCIAHPGRFPIDRCWGCNP